MYIEQLAKEVNKFIEDSFNHHVEYEKGHNKLKEQLKNEMIGANGFRDGIDALRKETNNLKINKANELREKIERVKEAEYENIAKTSETITTDGLAELQLISQLDLTNDEFNHYLDKYKRNPLALKKLQDIAKTKDMHFVNIIPDRKEYLNTILGRMETKINQFSNMPYDEYTVKVQMYHDGAIRSINEDVAYYNGL